MLSTRRRDAHTTLAAHDPVWAHVRGEAEQVVRGEPELAAFIYASVLNHESLEDAVCHRLAQRLDHDDVNSSLLFQTYREVLHGDPDLSLSIRADLAAVLDRDPACNRVIEPVLYFKGFHAIQNHRFAHRLWHLGRRNFALYLQSRASAVFGVDIHPAAQLGRGLMFDHATGIVIGETAVIGDNSSLLHGVTLGGSGKETGDRHPKIGSGVLIGAGAKILGNITVGNCSRIAAGSVVLKDVPEKTTVAGIPARVVGEAGCSQPSRTMDQLVGGTFLDRGA
jgi:serine O-acetyltransferase